MCLKQLSLIFVPIDSTGSGSVLVHKFELLPPNLRITTFSDFDLFFSLQLLKFYFILILQWWLKIDSRMIQYYDTVLLLNIIFLLFWLWNIFGSYFQTSIFEMSFSFFFFNDHSLLYRWSNAILMLLLPGWSHWLLFTS